MVIEVVKKKKKFRREKKNMKNLKYIEIYIPLFTCLYQSYC